MATKQAVIVNDRDVFNYLKVCMYSDSINDLRRSGKKIRSGVFYETIRMLENVDSGLNKIEDNIISTEVAYLDSDYETQKEIIHFLNLLRLDEELIEFAKNIDTFFSTRMGLFIQLVRDDFPEFYKRDYDWTRSDLPLKQIFDCIAKYRDLCGSYQEGIKRNLEDCNEQHIGLAKIFDKVVKKAKKVYVLNLMIKIHPNSFSWKEASDFTWDKDGIEHVERAIREFYSNIVPTFNVYADFVNTFMGVNECINLHIVLVLKNEGEHDSKLLVKQMWDIFNSLLNKRKNSSQRNDYDIQVDSLNERIKHRFKQKHVTDVLGYRSKKQLEDFNYWYLYLFTHFKRFIVSEHCRFRGLSFDPYELGYRISAIFREIKETELEYRPEINQAQVKDVSLNSLYREFVGNKLWEKAISKLDHKKEYVGLCHIYGEQKHFLKFESNTSELLQRQELFIQYLKQVDIPPLSTVDAKLEHIVQSPSRHLSLIEKLTIIQLLDHDLSGNNAEHLTSIIKGTSSPSLNFLLNDYKKNRDVVYLSSYSVFSLDFYRELHKYINGLKEKIHKNDLAKELAKGVANRQKNTESINQYLLHQFKQDVNVYRFKMTCEIEIKNVSEALVITAFSEIWTAFVKDIKRKPKSIGKQLVAYVGAYVSLNVPSIDVTLIFASENKCDFEVDTVDKINECWKNYLTDETKSQLIRKLEKRKLNENQTGSAKDINYDDFFKKLHLKSIRLPLINENMNHWDDCSLCSYSDKKQRSRFIKTFSEFYASYSLLKRPPIEGRDVGLNLMLKGRLPQKEQSKAIPAPIFKPVAEIKD